MTEQTAPLNFVCVNVGQRYDMAYVAILRDMIARHVSTTERPIAFWCVTDRADELPAGVHPIEADPALPGYWQKLALFSPRMPWPAGARIVYFDLDVCIVGRLEDLVERKGIARDHGWPTHNSSVMVWDHGEHREVWDRFTPDVMTRSPGPLVPARALPKGVPNGGDQEWITEVGGWTQLPADWCVSYKWQAKAWPPSGSKVVIMHGDPKPADITDGWVPNVWRIGGFTAFPVMRGANVTPEFLLRNVRANLARSYLDPREPWAPGKVRWFTGYGGLRDTEDTCAIVCGGPSMAEAIGAIRERQRKGAKIVSVNNALRYLMDRGIKPHAHIMLDARPENAEFVRDAPEGVRYLLAAQCHPEVFDALREREVVLWHNFDGSDVKSLLEPYARTRPVVLVPGGGTVGLRALSLAWLSGYRKVHVYGMQGSYSDDGRHHAYDQALNDGERTVTVQHGGTTYRCALWMVRQAEELRETMAHLERAGVRVFFHGSGLIPDIWRTQRDKGRTAA